MDAKTNGPKELLQSITSALTRVLKCPACSKIVDYPVQCENGHLFCAECQLDATFCSLCQQPFLKSIKLTCLNNLLEVIPRFCKYKEEGCDQVFQLKDGHERFCGFRLMFCKTCFFYDHVMHEMKVHEAYAHCLEKHVSSLPTYNEDSNTCVVSGVDITKLYPFSAYTEILVDERLFYIHIRNNTIEKNVKIAFEELPLGEQKTKYSLMVELRGSGYVLQRTVKALAIRGDSLNEGLYAICINKLDSAEDFIMNVPYSMWPYFVHRKEDQVMLEMRFTIKKG